jgi:hypothetical protein
MINRGKTIVGGADGVVICASLAAAQGHSFYFLLDALWRRSHRPASIRATRSGAAHWA